MKMIVTLAVAAYFAHLGLSNFNPVTGGVPVGMVPVAMR